MNVLSSLERRLESLAGPVELAKPRFDVEPVPLVAPRSIDEARELLRFAAADGLRVLPLGRGSKLGWCGIPGQIDFALSTRRLTRVVSHVPADGTITVEAGVLVSELRERCRAGGHFLTPDVPRPGSRTIGGVVAAGESGLDRLRFGPVRHHVLGTKVVLAGGALAKSGGQLVKNVTGYDLHRLYCGSHGTLALIVEVSLRLFPEPEHEVLLAAPAADARGAFEMARRALALPLRTVSLTLEPDETGRWLAVARLFGLRAAVEAERARLASEWPLHRAFEGSFARAEAERRRDAAPGASPERASLRATCPPSRVEEALAVLLQTLQSARLAPRALVQPGVAAIEVELAAEPLDSDSLARIAANLRTALARHEASLSLRNAPRAALAALDPFGASAPGLELMRAIQRQLDPSGVFRTGRFHGGL
jgi:glycolate oxidase FAD binding subunit